MANNIETICPPECPLRPMTHQHFQKIEGQPKKHKRKHRRSFDDEPNNQFMSRRNRKAKRG